MSSAVPGSSVNCTTTVIYSLSAEALLFIENVWDMVEVCKIIYNNYVYIYTVSILSQTVLVYVFEMSIDSFWVQFW